MSLVDLTFQLRRHSSPLLLFSSVYSSPVRSTPVQFSQLYIFNTTSRVTPTGIDLNTSHQITVITKCSNSSHQHHHHQFLLSLSGHRPSTQHRHLVLFTAILLTSLQLFPFSSASLWTVLRHVCPGLPLLFFPCGFQSKASLSMASCPFLSVCPIQFHFRLLICVDISISLVLLHSSSFEITFGQRMFRIRRKQRLTNVCSFEEYFTM